jgi:hypothetical protein
MCPDTEPLQAPPLQPHFFGGLDVAPMFWIRIGVRLSLVLVDGRQPNEVTSQPSVTKSLSSAQLSSTAMASITIRTATIADLDAIVKIAVDVIPQEPQVLYQYPYTDQFSDDCYRCTTEEIRAFFENGNLGSDTFVMVAEIEDELVPSGKTVIAHTVWDLMAVGRKATPVQDLSSEPKIGFSP